MNCSETSESALEFWYRCPASVLRLASIPGFDSSQRNLNLYSSVLPLCWAVMLTQYTSEVSCVCGEVFGFTVGIQFSMQNWPMLLLFLDSLNFFFPPGLKEVLEMKITFFPSQTICFLLHWEARKNVLKYKARLVKYDRSLLCMCSLGDDNEAFSDDFHRSAVLLEALGLYSVHNCGFVSSFLTLNVLYSKHRTPLGSHTSPSVATHELCFESHDLSVTINSSLSLYSKGDVMFTSQNQADSLVVSMELFSKRVELFPCTVNKLWPLCL